MPIVNADCSLREAVNAANEAGGTNTITFDSTAFAIKQTISTKLTAFPNIHSNLSIAGSKAGVTITSRLIGISSGTVMLSNLTFTFSGSEGIRVLGGSTTVQNCTLRDAVYDITIRNNSTVVVQNSSITGNSIRGIIVFSGTGIVQNSTITGTGIGIDILDCSPYCSPNSQNSANQTRC